uniref:Rhodopsin domain-containing protein n=1 Tax=Bionectria ochroleuca TaxID=29856 RepID=A0A8H7K779_BIOOC
MEIATYESAIPIENSRQLSILVVSTLCVAFSLFIVGLRVFAKYKISKPLDASDFCSLIALIFSIALHTTLYVIVLKGGLGLHIQDLIMRFGPNTVIVFFKCTLVFSVLWNSTTCFTKLSVLFMYMAFFPVRKMILACRILGAFIIIWNVTGIITVMLLCRPLAMNWDRSIGGTCGSQPDYYMALGVVNIVVEVVMLAFPFPVLYGLQISIQKKIVVFGMFGVGFAACGVTIYRQTTIPSLEYDDMPWSSFLSLLFSGLEPSAALILSCVPFLRPYFKGAFPRAKTGYSYTPEGEAGRTTPFRAATGHSSSSMKRMTTHPMFSFTPCKRGRSRLQRRCSQIVAHECTLTRDREHDRRIHRLS